MIRTVRELLDEIENQVGDHDESEVPVTVDSDGNLSLFHISLQGVEFFDGALVLHVEGV